MENLIYPTKFIGICTYFTLTHRGIDIYTNKTADSYIYSAGVGKVIKVHDNDKTKKSWGNYVKISHGENIYTLYAHLKEGIYVKEGQMVDCNTVLGIMGNTGKSYGRHLHYEVYDGGLRTKYRKDPEKYTYAVRGFHELSIKPSALKGVKFIDKRVSVSKEAKPSVIDYVVVKGDNLSKIASMYGSTWRKIYNDNKARIGSDPNLLKVGTILKITLDK